MIEKEIKKTLKKAYKTLDETKSIQKCRKELKDLAKGLNFVIKKMKPKQDRSNNSGRRSQKSQQETETAKKIEKEIQEVRVQLTQLCKKKQHKKDKELIEDFREHYGKSMDIIDKLNDGLSTWENMKSKLRDSVSHFAKISKTAEFQTAASILALGWSWYSGGDSMTLIWAAIGARAAGLLKAP